MIDGTIEIWITPARWSCLDVWEDLKVLGFLKRCKIPEWGIHICSSRDVSH